MTKQDTNKLVTLALANWPNMQDKGVKIEITAALWYKMLGHIPYELAEAGLAKVLMTAKFFPTIAELLEAIESLKPKRNAMPSADEAWTEVCRNLDPYKVPDWSHEAVRKTVKQLGGIRAICECDNMSPVRAHFFKLYEFQCQREKDNTLNQKVISLIGRTAELKFLGE